MAYLINAFTFYYSCFCCCLSFFFCIVLFFLNSIPPTYLITCARLSDARVISIKFLHGTFLFFNSVTIITLISMRSMKCCYVIQDQAGVTTLKLFRKRLSPINFCFIVFLFHNFALLPWSLINPLSSHQSIL